MGINKRIPTGKTFEIDSFEKLLNVVDEDNIGDLGICLFHYLHHYTKVIKEYRKTYPKECKGKLNYQIIPTSFIWTDDGIEELTKVQMVNSKTGEKFTTELKKIDK